VAAALKRQRPRAVALGIRNLDNCFLLSPRSYFSEVQQLVAAVRRTFDGPVILGGSGFSVEPDGWMRRLGADYGVIGEGEDAFVELLAALDHGTGATRIDGVITANVARPATNGREVRSLGDIVALTSPAHELCRYRSYVRRGGYVGVQTKRGCPFKCAYCNYPHLEGTRYRLRPPEAVAEEIGRVARDARARHFFFVDSVFNDPRQHSLSLCAELTRQRLPIRWMAFCNPVGFDSELASAMARAGCDGVEFGIDAATPKMLAVLRKPFGQGAIRAGMQAAQDAGLPFALHLLFGGPGETWSDVEDTQRFLGDCPPANAVFAGFGIRVYRKTAMEKLALEEGVISPETDLFEPTYYVSPHLRDRSEEHLDRIVRQQPEWSSPVDWRRPVMQAAQKLMGLLNVRPQWKDIRNYGLRLR